MRTIRNSRSLVVGSASGEVFLYRIDRGGQNATVLECFEPPADLSFGAAAAAAVGGGGGAAGVAGTALPRATVASSSVSSSLVPGLRRGSGGSGNLMLGTAGGSSSSSSPAAITCLEQFDSDLESLVVLARQNGALQGWDIRRDSLAWSVPRISPWLGVPSCMALASNGHSVFVGTLGGGLLAYDLRFLANWKQWRLASGAGVLAMRSSNFVTSPSVFVSMDSTCNEVALFDITKGSCTTLFLTEPVVDKPQDSMVSVPTLLQVGPDSFRGPCAENFLGETSRTSRAMGSVRSLWLPSGSQSYLLAAGADRKVRHWSLDPEHFSAEAYVVTPQDPIGPGERGRERTTYSSNHLGDVFVVQEQSAQNRLLDSSLRSSQLGFGSNDASAPNSNHRDAVLDMCTISLHTDILVTAGRDGLVKLWK